MPDKKIEWKIDLVRTFMQFEGNITLNDVCYNYDRNGGVQFHGHSEDGDKTKSEYIAMDKNQVEAINDCNSINEIYNCYKEMEYF